MRVAHWITRSVAAASLASFAACVVPPPGVAPRPEEDQNAAPDVSLYSFDQSPGGAGANLISYSTTRDAYVAAFAVDQDGWVRVVTPSRPGQYVWSTAGRSYVLFPSSHARAREALTSSTDFSRVPFMFVLTSDTPIDLSLFGTGREWTNDVRVTGGDPQSAITELARRVLPNAPAYGSDYAYVGPQLRAGEQEFVAACARPVEDVHDYGYYRDLWAVFTPADERLSVNPWLFTPTIGWSSYAMLPLAMYRAEMAPSAFYAGCTAPSSTYLGANSLAYTDLILPGFGFYGYRPYGIIRGVPGYGAPGSSLPGLPAGGGTIAMAPNGHPVIVPPLRIPRIPNTPGVAQTVGTAPAPGTAGVNALAAGQAPGRLAWRQAPGVHGPGEVQAMRPGIASGNRPTVLLPVERRGYERPPMSGGVARGYGSYGARQGSEPRAWSNGQGMSAASSGGAATSSRPSSPSPSSSSPATQARTDPRSAPGHAQ